jgi:NADH-quinone oxidoreductase subunit E
MLQEKFAAEIETLLARYPHPRSAVLPVLYLAQDAYGQLTPEIIREVAEVLGISYTDVFEVVGFYTLFYDQPFGRWMLQVCDDVPCCYSGAEELIQVLKQQLGIREDQTSSDGMFTLQRVKCLAACHRAPVVQANLAYIYDVTAERAEALLTFLRTNAESGEGFSVSGRCAEDYDALPDGSFRRIERVGAAPLMSATPAGQVNGSQMSEPDEAARAQAEARIAAESSVNAAPDHSPAGAHPAPDRRPDEQVPPNPAQQTPPGEA